METNQLKAMPRNTTNNPVVSSSPAAAAAPEAERAPSGRGCPSAFADLYNRFFKS